MTQSWSKRPKTIALILAGMINAILIYLIYRDFSTLVTTLGTTGDPGANGLRLGFLILFLVIFNVSLVVIFFWKKSSLVRAGLIVAVVPIIGAFLYSLLKSGSMFDESAGGGGFLWLLMISAPIGLMLIAIGVIVELAKRSRSQSAI
ncbi:MAG: hypothetical protein F2839_04870 [Actinobacteria bacterium]|uniref:Unannotated protein n=1 Tax=freshwater metagenome TaxID=449393 RepID=A0A6J5ZGC2_9ZZZZ|nr:hypothetical protein [Actinomycetota bacterium]